MTILILKPSTKQTMPIGVLIDHLKTLKAKTCTVTISPDNRKMIIEVPL